MSVQLEDFTMYQQPKTINNKKLYGKMEENMHSNQMVSIYEIIPSPGQVWCFDGTICYGDSKAYVQKVPFEVYSIGGYEDLTADTVGQSIWIQSFQAQHEGIWYQLMSPAPEYEPYHEPFLWVADLAKHVIDYMSEHEKVCLADFKSRFFTWLESVHGSRSNFRLWQQKYGDTDFRRALSAHAEFLVYQATQVDAKYYKSHPLWGEISWGAFTAVPAAISTVSKTVVTPYVHRCFKHLPWARFLLRMPLNPPVYHAREEKQWAFGLQKRQMRYAEYKEDENSSTEPQKIAAEPSKEEDIPLEENKGVTNVAVGDVIGVMPDEGKVSMWKTKDALWYGYVQEVREHKKGQTLSVIWLYRPSDTACQSALYPYPKELFLSNHCNCKDSQLWTDEVVQKVTVAFHGEPDTIGDKYDYFVRQKYISNYQSWETLKETDFRCTCKAPTKSPTYEVGDTLLISTISSVSEQVLEPVELIELAPGGRKTRIRVRQLLRRGRDYNQEDAEPNELVYTNTYEVVDIADIYRPCHIRFYTNLEKELKKIPELYRRGGMGDFYYILYQDLQHADLGLIPMSAPWPSTMKQGWNPAEISKQPVMRGLDIFCGGGNLGRGLEEGGAVKMGWAVDYFSEAIHTYRANLAKPDDAKLYFGSVNDYLSQAMQGAGGKSVAAVGSVDMISAGSPCQGFSNANHNKGDDKALINVSMVASVVSFVDVYRPKYAILENVVGMARCQERDADRNVFANVLCALVGLGYQVRVFILDAWNFGSPQSRTRLFICVAAPCLTPLENPPHSHAHPASKKSSISLGKSANGLKIGERNRDPAPFKFVNIADATKDIPLNFYGRTDSIQFPDNRCSRSTSMINRIRATCIPRYPPLHGMLSAREIGWMPSPQVQLFNWGPKDSVAAKLPRCWRRVQGDGLLPTVTTSCQPEDGMGGPWLHWHASRMITIMEARRAQGFPDSEVIVGKSAKQWKIIGNSVARPVSLALGMALRKAWMANLEDPAKAPLADISSMPISDLAVEIPDRPVCLDQVGPITKYAKAKVTSILDARL